MRHSAQHDGHNALLLSLAGQAQNLTTCQEGESIDTVVTYRDGTVPTMHGTGTGYVGTVGSCIADKEHFGQIGTQYRYLRIRLFT